MRTNQILPLAAGFALALTAPVTAQVRLSALIGVTGSSSLVNDQIIQQIELKPALAPTFLLSASIPIATKLNASLDLGYSSSTAELTEDGASAGDLGTLGAFTASAAVMGPLLLSRLSWRLSLGVLQYVPSDKEGVFADGVPAAALFGAGLDWRHPLSDRWAGVLGVRYDFHLFTTPALEAAGFAGSQQVSRLGLAIGAAWNLP
jgi:hypothetical protein